MRWPAGRSPAIALAASRSAVPVAVVVAVATTRPFRFSIGTCAMWHSWEGCPADLRNSRASGSVVEACVLLLRFSPPDQVRGRLRKSRSPFRPGCGGSPLPSLGRKPADFGEPADKLKALDYTEDQVLGDWLPE